MALFFEKIAVAASALEKQAIRFQSIDKKPIRLDVAIAGTLPLADESMVAISGFQGRPRNQDKNDFFQFLEILALFFEFFHIPPELAGFMNRPHSSQLSKS